MMEKDGIKGAECERVREDLSAYLDGELDAADAERIKNHIDNCDDCRELFEMLSDISEDIRSAEIDMPEDLHLRIMNAVNAEKAKDGGKKAKNFNSRIRKIALWCGAGAAAIICLTLIGSPIFRGGFELDMAKSADDAANFAQNISFSGKAADAAAEEVCEAAEADYSLFDVASEDGAAAITKESKYLEYYSGSAEEEEKDLEAVAEDTDLLSELQCIGNGKAETAEEAIPGDMDNADRDPIDGQNYLFCLTGAGEENAPEMLFIDFCAMRGNLVPKKHE